MCLHFILMCNRKFKHIIEMVLRRKAWWPKSKPKDSCDRREQTSTSYPLIPCVHGHTHTLKKDVNRTGKRFSEPTHEKEWHSDRLLCLRMRSDVAGREPMTWFHHLLKLRPESKDTFTFVLWKVTPFPCREGVWIFFFSFHFWDSHPGIL